MPTIIQLLTTLGFKQSAIDIYLDLLTHGETNARQLALRLGVPRSSVYDQVKPLLEANLVSELDKDGRAVFAVQDIDDLNTLIEKRAYQLNLLKIELKKAKDTLLTQSKLSTEPKLRFVEGREGMVSLLLDMLFEAGEEIETVWPYEEMLKVLPESELAHFNRRRIKDGVRLKTIWTGAVPSKKNYLWRGGDYLVERRIAPKKYAADMAYSIYGDSVLFFSSASEQYAFVVKSRDFACMMRAQFRALWDVSKPGEVE
jgi:HTH-type transcriptional regulator, sugar sensing transcriptional regulator